jgi:hypothetical protein
LFQSAEAVGEGIEAVQNVAGTKSPVRFLAHIEVVQGYGVDSQGRPKRPWAKLVVTGVKG